MSEIVQQVRTVFRADARGLRSELGRVSDQLSRLQRLAIGLAGSYGLSRLVRGLIDVNAKSETSALGIATMVQAADRMRGRITPFSNALGIAKGTLEDLRQVAVDTPATFDQVAESFRAIVFPARTAGMGMKQIAQLAGDVATLESAEGSPGMISRDIQQLMRGTNNIDSQFLRPFKNELLKLVNQGKQGQALKRISEIIQMDPAARKAFGESFDGRMSTFQDQIQAIQRAAGEPIFEVANEQLAKMSEWLSKNKDEVKRVSRAVGEGLVSAFTAVKDAVAWLVESGVGAFALKVYVGVKAVGLLVGAFRMLSPVLGALASHPLWAVIAGSAALIAAVINGINGWQNKTSADMKAQADSNRGNFGKVGGTAATIGNAIGAALSGNWSGAQELATDGILNANDGVFSKKLLDTAGQATKAELDRVEKQRREQAAAAANASDMRRRVAGESQKAVLAKGTIVNAPIDARGSKITVNTKLETDDPARFANASLVGAFGALAARPLSATFGLGAPPLANGAR